MSKIICFNCGEYWHFAHDCPKALDNANIAQESEQKGKSESMLDLDSTSVREKCAMVCTELQYEDVSEDEVVYGDQGISTEDGFGEHVGDSLTHKLLDDDTKTILYKYAVRPSDSTHPNRHLVPDGGESSQTPKPIMFVRSRQDDSQSATRPMAEYNADDII